MMHMKMNRNSGDVYAKIISNSSL